MSGPVRCPHCGQQHPKEVKTCPTSGQPMPGTLTIGDLLHGQYRVIRYVGEGGLGVLYEADAGGRRVTVEVAHPDLASHPDALSAFYDEARMAGGPHSAQVFDAGRAGDGSPYLVIEPLDGITLAGRLEQEGGRLDPGRAAHITCQILDGLAPLHRQGLFHRALAPEHVFLLEHEGDPDYVKVLDLGFGRLIDLDGARARAIAYGYPLPYYMAPEQAFGGQPDQRADIYACGAMLYTMVTGEPPYPGRDYVGVRAAIGGGRYQPPRAQAPDVPPEMEQAIGYAMASDPSQRFQSAEQLLQALASFASPASLSTTGREKTMRPSRENATRRPMDDQTSKSSSRAIPIIVGFILAAAVPGVLLAVRGTGKPAVAVAPDVKPVDPVDKPTDPKPTPTLSADAAPAATATASADAATGTGTTAAATPDAGKAATTAAASPDAGKAATTAAATPDAAPAKPTVAETKPDAGVPPKAKLAVLTFTVKPKDAKITVDGKPVLGKLELPPGEKPVKVAVTAPGYVAFEQQITVKADDHIDVELKKVATAATKPPTKPTTPRKPRKPRIEL